MNNKIIFAHCLVKNEARFLWYSVSSIVDHVDKILLWDTGSTDGSIEIEKELIKKYPTKIEYKLRPQTTASDFANVRQEMLEVSNCNWVFMLDADEIWWRDSIKKVTDLIQEKGNEIESIVVPTINLVGNMYHKQEEKAGRYELAGYTGHYNLRALNRNIPGLHSQGEHGVWGWADEEGKMIQERSEREIEFVNAPYLHTTFLERSGLGKGSDVVKRRKKLKYEIGERLPKDFYYPESFFRKRSSIVESPWSPINRTFKIRALIETPFRRLKRRIWWGKAGY